MYPQAAAPFDALTSFSLQTTVHPHYEVLAGRLAISNLHKETSSVFADVINKLHKYTNAKTGKYSPLIADDVYAIVMANAERIEQELDYKRDYDYGFFRWVSPLLFLSRHVVSVGSSLQREDLVSKLPAPS